MYELPLRERAWLTVARSLFEKIPQETKLMLASEANINLSVTDSDAVIILKLVEIEAFILERKLKNLEELSPEELDTLYKEQLLWGSLLSSLTATEELQPETSALSLLKYQILQWLEIHPPTLVRVSESLFHSAIEEVLQFANFSDAERKVYTEAINTQNYTSVRLGVFGCTIIADSSLKSGEIQFMTFGGRG